MIVARWSEWSGQGLEHLVLRPGPLSVVAEGILLGGSVPFAASYRIVCDEAWRVRRSEITLLGDERRLVLSADGEGRWTDGAGDAFTDLDGAIDVDFSASPFTNTLPIRRLYPVAGQSVEVAVVLIELPQLTVGVDRQRYTCLEPRRYRFEALDSGFVREIETDEHGLVVTYPDLFRRVL